METHLNSHDASTYYVSSSVLQVCIVSSWNGISVRSGAWSDSHGAVWELCTEEITGYLVRIKIGVLGMKPYQRWQRVESYRKSRQVRNVLCMALLFSLKPESPDPRFSHTLGGYERDTNINIEDHFLLVCLYLCTEGEIYLFQVLTQVWFQALMKHYSFLHE